MNIASHPQTNEEIISFQKLRTFIGITGIILPVLLVLGCFVTGAGHGSLQPSISHFYYSKMHIVFTGILCVLGGFLISYKGKVVWESRLSNIAGLFSFGIAAFPTTIRDFIYNESKDNRYLFLSKEVTDSWKTVHFVFAGALFACFAIFCLYFFQKPDKTYTGKELQKFRRRKLIYKISGWTIIASILLIVVLQQKNGILRYSTFIFETTALWAFGTAWLVKGSAIWKNVPVVRKIVAPLR